MADRMIDPTNNDPQGEITDELKAVVQAVLNEAVSKMEAGEEIIPFTGLAVKENLFIETHPGDDAETCFTLARREVEGARGANTHYRARRYRAYAPPFRSLLLRAPHQAGRAIR